MGAARRALRRSRVIHRILGRHFALAAALAGFVMMVGLVWNTRVAAGADAYGYISQADLWLRGDLHIDQPFGATVPWPMARWLTSGRTCGTMSAGWLPLKRRSRWQGSYA